MTPSIAPSSVAFALAVALASTAPLHGCSSGEGQGPTDASSGDSAVNDASDGGAPEGDAAADAFEQDAPAPDASVTDALADDASEVDATAPDALTTDAGDASIDDGGGSDALVDAADAGDAGPPFGISVSPPSVALIGVSCGALVAPATVTITNVGTSDATWTATIPSPFSVDPTSSTLAPGQSATVTVTAAASSAPVTSGQLAVSAVFSNGGNPLVTSTGPVMQEVTTSVTETVDGCFIQNPAQAVDFGSVSTSSMATMTVPSPVESCRTQSEQGAPELSVSANGPFYVASNNGANWTVGFRPSTTGVQSATFTFTMIVGTGPVCDPRDLSFTATGIGVSSTSAGGDAGGDGDSATLGSSATSVSVGGSACALTVAGGLECWGYNGNGQLGNNTTTSSSVPVPVSGLTTGVTAVSVAGNYACAVTASGGVKCWGDNLYGQLGNNSTTSSSVPVQVSGLTSGVTAVSAGSYFACAIAAGGGVVCWGLNGSGQLGNNSTTNSSVPVQVSGLTSGVIAVSVGTDSACAVTASGVVCWGDNQDGELGNNSTASSSVPVAVSGLTSGVTAVSVKYSSACAITAGGGVECWGLNSSGQLGNNSTTNSSSPVPVSGLTTGVTAVSVGAEYSACALVAGGGVWCWGYNSQGELGNNSTTSSSVPVQVSGLTGGVTDVSVGGQYACAVTAGGVVECWGESSYGGATSLVPVPVSGL